MDHDPTATMDNHWGKLSAAIDTVDSLPHDPAFIEMAREHSLSITTTFTQGERNVCFDNSPALREILPFISELQDRHIVVNDLDISLKREGDFYNLSGNLSINGTEIVFLLNKDQLLGVCDHESVFNFTPDNLRQILLLMAGAFVDEKPSDVEAILNSLAHCDDSMDQLEETIRAMGNFTGMSTHTILSLLTYDSNNGIIVELTEVESPENTDSH